MVTPALEARGLSVGYPGGEQVLGGLELVVAPGELVCLLGPNGAGKSCLLRTLGGLFPPRSGEVLVGGRALARLRARERARAVASVPQRLAALPDVRVEEFVLGGRYAHRHPLASPAPADRAAVRRALARADVAELGERALHALSGGQLQRVLLARALAQEAPLLLFDEPTASLDPGHQVAALETIALLVAEEGAGRAALVATHELGLVGRFATRVLLLGEGGLLADGPPALVLTPERLEPAFGRDLLFLHGPRVPGQPEAPVVVPWPRRDPPPG